MDAEALGTESCPSSVPTARDAAGAQRVGGERISATAEGVSLSPRGSDPLHAGSVLYLLLVWEKSPSFALGEGLRSRRDAVAQAAALGAASSALLPGEPDAVSREHPFPTPSAFLPAVHACRRSRVPAPAACSPFLCAMSEPPVPWGAIATVALPSVVAACPGWHLSPRQQPFCCSRRHLPCTCGLPELPAASRQWGRVVAASCRGTCAEPSCHPGPPCARAPGVGRAALPQHAGTLCSPGTGRGSGAHLVQASSASLTPFPCLSFPF